MSAAKAAQCRECRFARPAQGALGRALGLTRSKFAYACDALAEAPRDSLPLVDAVSGILLTLAKGRECPSFEAFVAGPDAYRAKDLI